MRISMVEINHSTGNGRIRLICKRNTDGKYQWYEVETGLKCGVPAADTIEQANEYAKSVWGANCWNLEFVKSGWTYTDSMGTADDHILSWCGNGDVVGPDDADIILDGMLYDGNLYPSKQDLIDKIENDRELGYDSHNGFEPVEIDEDYIRDLLSR